MNPWIDGKTAQGQPVHRASAVSPARPPIKPKGPQQSYVRRAKRRGRGTWRRMSKTQRGLVILAVAFVVGTIASYPHTHPGPCHSYTTCEIRTGHELSTVPVWASKACATDGMFQSDGYATSVNLSEDISAGFNLYVVHCSDGVPIEVSH
jgi:hypothetical protein